MAYSLSVSDNHGGDNRVGAFPVGAQVTRFVAVGDRFVASAAS